MKRLLWMIALIFCAAQQLRGAEAPPVELLRGTIHAEITASINKAVEYFKSEQNADGSWGKTRHPTIVQILGDGDKNVDPEASRTAMVALALLAAGETSGSPAVSKALQYMNRKKPVTVYALSMHCAVLSLLGDTHSDRLRVHARALVDAAVDTGELAGLFTYGNPADQNVMWHAGAPDSSNSQYGVLGLWYAANAGVPVSRDFWKRVEHAWQKVQGPDGGWPYRIGEGSRASMTTAGVAVLYITQDFLHARDAIGLGKPAENVPLGNGLAWLAKNFSVAHNAGNEGGPDMTGRPQGWGRWKGLGQNGYFIHYMLYGYERVGEASGLTRFGEHIWYDEGARFLIETQNPKGFWRGSNTEIEDTAFSLLFLTRGRAPVAMQKLQFSGRWNNRPRDTARTIRWLREQSERHVNWQVVSADQPLDDLLEAPVLYAASNEPINLTEEQEDRIKQFLMHGGLLLCANEGGKRDFAQSVQELGRKWFPQYAFREITGEHPILHGNFQVKDLLSPVLSLSNGVRELIVLLPGGDLPARWHSPSAANEASRESPYLIVGNLVPYANGRTNPQYKGERVRLVKDEKREPQRRIHMARLQHRGNWDPEPLAWQRFASQVWNNDLINLQVHECKLGITPIDNNVKMAHMTLTDPIELTLNEDSYLRDYVKNGGTLVIDVAGGSRETGQAVEKMLSKIFIGELLKPIPPDHPIYTGVIAGGNPISAITYRRWTEERLPRTKLGRLKGITIDGRLAVIYSNEDITFGLTGGLTDGVLGYTPETSMELMHNILVFAAAAPRKSPVVK